MISALPKLATAAPSASCAIRCSWVARPSQAMTIKRAWLSLGTVFACRKTGVTAPPDHEILAYPTSPS